MKRPLIFWIVCVFAVGCAEDDSGTTSDVVIPALNYSDYDLSTFEKGAPLDQEDLAVLAGQPALVEIINQNFESITLNLFYVDLGFTAGCLDNQNEDYRLPALAIEALERVRARNINVTDVVVNVELLTPSRLPSSESDVPVLGLCGGDGEGYPTFASPDHRSQLKRDFAALADLPGLKRVSVGVDMNALYHAGNDGEFGFDYSNYVTAYHEIYAVIKDSKPNVAVGPGLSYRVFEQQTMPFAAQEVLQLESCTPSQCDLDGNLAAAAYEAYRLVVEPLLSSGPFDMPTSSADFLDWTVIPSSANEPFTGSPSFDEVDGGASPARRQAILDYFKPLLYVGSWTEIPYRIQQSDWTGSRGKSDKGVFLDVMLTSLTPNPPASLGWRRFTDLPRDEIAGTGAGNSICRRIVSPGREEFKRPEDYCSSGLVDANGSAGSYGEGTIMDMLLESGN